MNKQKGAGYYYGISVAVYSGILCLAKIVKAIFIILLLPVILIAGLDIYTFFTELTYIALTVALIVMVYKSKRVWIFPLACLTSEAAFAVFSMDFTLSGVPIFDFVENIKHILLVFSVSFAISAAECFILSKKDKILSFGKNIFNIIRNTILNGGKEK